MRSIGLIFIQCIFHHLVSGEPFLPDQKQDVTFIDYSSDPIYTGSIPGSYGDLSSLTSLILDNNQLTGSLISLQKLVGLEHLSLRNNSFTSIQGLSALTRLTHLDLGYNGFFGDISDITSAFPNMTFLFLAGNDWTCPLPNYYLISTNDYFDTDCTYHSIESFSCDPVYSFSQSGWFPRDGIVSFDKSKTITDDQTMGVEFFVRSPSEGCFFQMGGMDSPWTISFTTGSQGLLQIKLPNRQIPEDLILALSTNITDGRWHHIIISYEPDLMLIEVYVDDQLEVWDSSIGKSPFSTDANGKNDTNTIGSCSSSQSAWSGEIELFHLYNCAASTITPPPTLFPTSSPTINPTFHPSQFPTLLPSLFPTADPSFNPTQFPTFIPTAPPSKPTLKPTRHPTNFPTCDPTYNPSSSPSRSPSFSPTLPPSLSPTSPSLPPSYFPTSIPTCNPTFNPTSSPSQPPSFFPTTDPTFQPSSSPSGSPSNVPTFTPSLNPTNPTFGPTTDPSQIPTCDPTFQPTSCPSRSPSLFPTVEPTAQPSKEPSYSPTAKPTNAPSSNPSRAPSYEPSRSPSPQPHKSTPNPTHEPTGSPTGFPTTSKPSRSPTPKPTPSPTPNPTMPPTFAPTFQPSAEPSLQPSMEPSLQPSMEPSLQPSMEPSLQPSMEPSLKPSAEPSLKPTTNVPTKAPTIQDTVRLAGNYDELFPSDKAKEDFKEACSEAMHPVQCTEVVSGSIIVTILGPKTDVAIRKQAPTVNIEGYGTFTILDDEVAKTSNDGGSNIGGMSQAVFFILVALIVIILLLSIVLAKLVFNFDFGMKSNGGGATGVKRCWPYGSEKVLKRGPALSVNSMDVEDGTGVELVENDKDKRHPGSTDLETKSLPELPGENSEEENGVSNFEAQNDEEVLESQIVEIQGLLANKHILDPHKVFELEEELGGLRTLKAFITQDSERL